VAAMFASSATGTLTGNQEQTFGLDGMPVNELYFTHTQMENGVLVFKMGDKPVKIN
jgi:hypothetical protein